jgi:hypothetical protein
MIFVKQKVMKTVIKILNFCEVGIKDPDCAKGEIN